MNPMQSSLSFNTYQLIADFVSSITPTTPPCPTPLNYFETNPRHCITAPSPFICLLEPSVLQLPSPYPNFNKIDGTHSFSVNGAEKDRKLKSLHMGQVGKEQGSAMKFDAEQRVTVGGTLSLKKKRESEQAELSRIPEMIGGMEGKEGMLDFLQEVRGGRHAGLCVCVIIKMKSDSERPQILGTARQLAFGLQLHIPSFLSLKGKKILNLDTIF